jgi:two-component system phosphate regulon sensor histidine kinase PhoR
MTLTQHRHNYSEAWLSRLAGARLVLFAAAIVLGGLFVTGALDPAAAAIAFAIIAGAALVSRTPQPSIDSGVPSLQRAVTALSPSTIDVLIAALPDPVMALDHEGIVIGFNPGARAVAPALRIGEPASFALRVPEVVEAVRLAVATGEPQRIEFSDRVPVDRWYEVHVHGVHLTRRRNNEPPDLVLMMIRDLTPLRRVEEMRADFVANASHELRTPLATLSGFIETLQGPARDDAAARERFLVIMKQQAFRMARLIDDLLSLSRIELNVHVRPESPVDLVGMVRQVTDAMQMLAHDRGVDIVVNGPPDSLLVPGDRDELVRVFENLVENALKYGAAGKRVEIAIARQTGADGVSEAVVSVRDFGPGIAPEHLPRLTERFYRVDVAQSRAEGGTGLGLAIVKHILARHQGRLLVDSILGQGATFTARLPLAR